MFERFRRPQTVERLAKQILSALAEFEKKNKSIKNWQLLLNRTKKGLNSLNEWMAGRQKRVAESLLLLVTINESSHLTGPSPWTGYYFFEYRRLLTAFIQISVRISLWIRWAPAEIRRRLAVKRLDPIGDTVRKAFRLIRWKLVHLKKHSGNQLGRLAVRASEQSERHSNNADQTHR